MDSVLTLKDLLKYQDLLAKQFSEIGRLSLLSNTETWELFLEQEESDIIPRDHLPAVKGILFGSPTLSIEVFRDVATGVLKKHKYCTIIRVLYKLTKGNLIPELVNHSLKITSIVLSEEDMQNPYTVRYRDQDHTLREFCTYAKSAIDARLQALECITCVSDNPRCILDIIWEKEHTDSFEW